VIVTTIKYLSIFVRLLGGGEGFNNIAFPHDLISRQGLATYTSFLLCAVDLKMLSVINNISLYFGKDVKISKVFRQSLVRFTFYPMQNFVRFFLEK
jgi:hypothetical protein